MTDYREQINNLPPGQMMTPVGRTYEVPMTEALRQGIAKLIESEVTKARVKGQNAGAVVALNSFVSDLAANLGEDDSMEFVWSLLKSHLTELTKESKQDDKQLFNKPDPNI